jgi:FMN phosphatase YigB (HAD superfamily)
MRVLLFDVFGTLVDWRSSLIELAETTAPRDGPPALEGLLETGGLDHLADALGC